MSSRSGHEAAGSVWDRADRSISTRLAAAIYDLPEDASSLLAELARYAPMLNVNLRRGDDDYLPEGRLSFRLAATQERKITWLVRNVCDANCQRIDKQDVLGVALLRLLAAQAD